MARFNPSKLRSALSRYNSAVSRYNSAVRQHNANVRRAVSEYNRRVRRFNTQIQELRRQLALLERRPSARSYADLRLEFQAVVTYEEHTLIVRQEEWGQLDSQEQALLQDSAEERGVELMLVDDDGDEV